MGKAKQHLELLQNQIDLRLGVGKAAEILQGLDDLNGNETTQQCYEWALKTMERLDESVLIEYLIPIREGCACWQTKKKAPHC